MITCPNCGAGNKPESSACRMCAASLESVSEAPAAKAPAAKAQPPPKVSPAPAKSQSHHQEEAKAPVEQEGIVCPECSTLNEIGWSFCQHCGKRLVQAQPPQPQPIAPPPPAQVPDGLVTNPDQEAVEDPSKHQSFETVVSKPSPASKPSPVPKPAPHPPDLSTVAETLPPDQRLKTVSDQPGMHDDQLKTVRDTAPSQDQGSKPAAPKPPPYVDPESSTLRQEAVPASPPVPIEQPPQPAPPRIVHEPVSAKPAATKPRPAPPPPTVVADAPPQPKPAAPPPPPAPIPAPPPRASRPEHATEQAGSGVLCTQCGQATGVGSAFCASCGAPVTYGHTMVISSVAAPPPILKGRLHLVMEGGQPGEIYDLDDDTVIGRSNGAITFPHDGFMSGKHARIARRDGSFILSDEGSRNGTFVKIKGEVELKPGDTILVGKQLFRFEEE